MSAALACIDAILIRLDIETQSDSNQSMQSMIRERLSGLRIHCGVCSLRLIRDSDLEQLVKMANSEEVSKYLRTRFPHPYTMEDGKWWLKHNKELMTKYTNLMMQRMQTEEEKTAHGYFGLPCFRLQIVDKNTDHLIGGIGIESRGEAMGSHKVELGYWLNEQYWNKRIVTNSVWGLIDFMWNSKEDEFGTKLSELLTLNRIARIECEIATQNIYSAKAVENNGFRREGIQRKSHKFRDGTLGDVLCLSLLKEDYM